MGLAKSVMYAIFVLLGLTSLSFAYGYGTSSITLSQPGITVQAGTGGSVQYTVNLASGSTWGTNLNVVNQSQLASKGLTVTLSNPSGDPPYSGTLTVNASSSAAPGTYYVVLDATGDDPSTNNTTLTVTVEGQTSATTSATTSASTTTVIGSNTTVATTKPSTSTSASTSVAYTTTGAYYPPSGGGPGGLSATTAYLAGAVIALILGIIGIFRAKSNEWKMVIAGAMLIFIGIFVWLYGDFSGGLMQYIYGGVAAAAVGILVWLYADFKLKMFSKMDRSSYAIILGVILLLIGMGLWLYADFGGGSLTDLWAGVGAMVLGVIVWAAAYFV